MKFSTLLLAATCICTSLLPVQAAEPVLDLLEQRCAKCHKGADMEEPELHAGIDLIALKSSTDDVKSILERVKLPADAKKRMPKSKGKEGEPDFHAPLTETEINLLESAITAKSDTVAKPNAATAATDLGESVLTIFNSRCIACHGTNAAEPKKFTMIDDLAKLRESQLVNLQVPEDSRLFTAVSEGDMPYLTKAEKQAGKKEVEPLSAVETATILSWIRAGAPVKGSPPVVAEATKPAPQIQPATTSNRPLVTPADEITLALADLQSVPREDQSDIRYVSLAVVHNNVSLGENEFENLRRGARKMLNSLSTGPRIVQFTEVGPQKTLLRIKLADIGWDAALWDKVASHFPLAIDTGVFSALGTACHTSVPILRADWLAANATRPPLYHEILRLPKHQKDLESSYLQVNVAENLKRGQAMRSGFSKSGISNANRLVERHDLPRNGSYWVSYDFKSSGGHSSLLQYPLGPKTFPDGSSPMANGKLAFEHAGGEFVFSLPNGLHGYFVGDVLGNRLEGPAPTNIVGDRDNITGRVEVSNGLSCITCHDRGLKDGFGKDEIRALAATFGAEEQRIIERLHPEPEVFNAKLKEDIGTFMAALKTANAEPMPGQREPVGQLSRIYDDEVSLDRAAAELGMAPAAMLDKLDAIPSLTDLRITFRRGGSFQREHFNDRFAELVARLTNSTVLHSNPITTVGHATKLNQLRAVPVLLTLDKKSYCEGEIPEITLEAAEDCHIRLLYQDARGDITVLFPNQFIENDSFRAGKSRLLPAKNPKKPGEQVAIEIFGGDDGKTFGTERFIVVATDQSFTDTTQLLAAAREAFNKTKVPFATDSSKNLDIAMTKAARAISRPASGTTLTNSSTQARVGFSSVSVVTRAK